MSSCSEERKWRGYSGEEKRESPTQGGKNGGLLRGGEKGKGYSRGAGGGMIQTKKSSHFFHLCMKIMIEQLQNCGE